jgi:NTP pyrophosphatase (non-canonical NTP hydrolase)
MKLSEEQERFFLKLIEEMQELSLELIHAVNKPKKNNQSKILSEIQDVETYIEKVKNTVNTCL